MNIRKDSTSNIKDYPYYFNSNLTKPAYEQIYLTNLAKIHIYNIILQRMYWILSLKTYLCHELKEEIGCLTHFHIVRIPFCK